MIAEAQFGIKDRVDGRRRGLVTAVGPFFKDIESLLQVARVSGCDIE